MDTGWLIINTEDYNAWRREYESQNYDPVSQTIRGGVPYEHDPAWSLGDWKSGDNILTLGGASQVAFNPNLGMFIGLDAKGKEIEGTQFSALTDDSAFWLAALAAGAVVGGAVGAGWGGVGAAGGYSSAPWAGESLKGAITGYEASSAPWAVGASEGGTAGASLLSGSAWDIAATGIEPAGTAYDMWDFNTPQGGYGPTSTGNSFFDSLRDWAKRRYAKMGFKDWARVAAGLYSLNNARQYQRAARLPSASEMASQPGYQAGLDAVRRQQVATGYGRSGAADVAAAQYGQNFYEQFARQRQMEAQAKYGGGGAMLSGLALLAGGFGG